MERGLPNDDQPVREVEDKKSKAQCAQDSGSVLESWMRHASSAEPQTRINLRPWP